VLKPSAEGLNALIQELGGDPARTLMVGDKPEDVLAGRGAGARTAAVTYGYGDSEAITASAPEHFLGNFAHLSDLIGKYNSTAPPNGLR